MGNSLSAFINEIRKLKTDSTSVTLIPRFGWKRYVDDICTIIEKDEVKDQ